MVSTAESGQRKVYHGLYIVGIHTRVWPTESGPWTIVHGIDNPLCSMESIPWTIVHGIDYGQQIVYHGL